jgi:altronate dehydratase small subunit
MSPSDLDRQGTQKAPDTTIDALQLSEHDNVATLLHAVEAGHRCVIDSPGGLRQVTTIDPIPMHHKIALQPIGRGQSLRKYGEVIGQAQTDIAEGAHVHIHNLVSLRARSATG